MSSTLQHETPRILHEILFSRQEGFDITHCAVARFSAKPPDKDHVNSFMILRDAVTRWVADTDEGKAMHIAASEDTNIGDVACALPPGALEPYGVYGLRVSTMTGDDYASYDAHLVDEEKLDELCPGGFTP